MTNLTRRNFIGVAGIAAAGLGLVGCGGSGSSDTKTDDGKSDATTDKVGASEDLVKAIIGVPRILSKKWLHNLVQNLD